MRAFLAALYRRNESIERVAEKISGNSNVRIIPENRRHVTLFFFADMSKSESENVCSALQSLNRSKFTANSKGISGFPDPGKARVVVLLLDSPDLIEIRGYLEKFSIGKYDNKKFTPHITVARSSRSPVNVSRYMNEGNGMKLEFTSISLIESDLSGGFPKYREICKAQLM